MTQADWVKEYSQIMLDWIESQWKIESAQQAGEPYTRMKFEAEASKLEDKLKDFISKVESLAQQRTEKKIILGLEELANSKLGKSVYQDGIRQGIRESQKYISDLNN